jgi:hypothetical protein
LDWQTFLEWLGAIFYIAEEESDLAFTTYTHSQREPFSEGGGVAEVGEKN